MVVLKSAGASSAEDLVNYWVSTGGSDTTGDGTESDPFLTIGRAQLAVRQDKFRGERTIRVNIEPGTYTLTTPLVFGPEDSGAKNAEVIYRAAPEADRPVVISGGTVLNNFNCNLLNVCTANVPNLPAGEMPRQFYVNDHRAIRARSNPGQPISQTINPNYTRIKNGNAYLQNSLPTQIFSHPELIEGVSSSQWQMMRCPVATQIGPLLSMVNPCWNNANSFPYPRNFYILSWLENAPEFMIGPNTSDMWFLDPYAQVLTYNNTVVGDPQRAVLPVLETLLQLQGTRGRPVSYLSFVDLQFSYATWLGPNSTNGYVADQSGNILEGSIYQPVNIDHQQVTFKTHGNISLKYASHITFDGDKFIHLGGTALDLDTGSQHNRITNNIFTDISSAAIQVGGFTPQDMRPDAEGVTRDNLIRNNDISFTGQEYYDSAGIFVGFTTGTVITHNNISYVPWSGIAIGWGWGLLDRPSFPGLSQASPGMWGNYSTRTIQSKNKITSNFFDQYAQQLWDVGAIYTNGSQGPNFADGLLIELNVAENKRPAAGGNTYYTDGGSQYVTLKQNVSLNNQVGTVDFGPCGFGSSLDPFCAGTGKALYGADIGGCLPVGRLTYIENYLAQPTEFYGPQICQNPYVPAFPVNLTFIGNVPTTSIADVPNWILFQAGTQGGIGPAWARP